MTSFEEYEWFQNTTETAIPVKHVPFPLSITTLNISFGLKIDL